MIDNELLKRLDISAYRAPDVIPREIMRIDKSPYRIYFRFVSLLYKLNSSGTLSVDELKIIKSAFQKDFEAYTLLSNAAAQSAREFMRLNAAVIACNKNKDNCEFCRGIYNSHMSPAENEPDVNMEYFNEST